MRNKRTTYKEILQGVPKEYCQAIARRIGLTDRQPPSVLREKIPQHLLDPAFLRNLIARLNPYERSILMMLAFSCDETIGVPFELFNRKLNQMSRKWPYTSRDIRRVLAESGLIFTKTVGNFRYRYMIPEDLRLLLLKIFAKDMNAALSSPAETPTNVRNDSFALIRDTFTFLSFASQYEIKLTQQRTIYKRIQGRILNRFEVAEDTPKVYDRINPMEGNTDRLDFIYQFCWRKKLIDHDHAVIRCSEAVQGWMRKSDPEKLEEMYNYWLEHYISRELSLTIAHSILQVLSPDRWVLVSTIQEQVSKFTVDAIWTQTVYSYLERSLVNHLTYMGVLALAPSTDDIAIQVTDLGRRLLSGEIIKGYEPESSFIVQPNYEILASNYVAPDIRWMLSHIAELHQADQVATYKVSDESIYDGLRSGISLDEILEFLKTHSKTGIPQNVEVSIREWAARYGQVYQGNRI